MGVLCTWVKLLTDLQILGCKLRTRSGSYSAPPDLLDVIRGGGGRGGEKRVGNKEGKKGREGKDMEG